ncbi:hypothetical protein B5X24_HaOG216263 [Helicoverpa armigera]|nr:hypothetical protein B5X24_HaOG216263 [Helicoverpa armigera]
MTFVDVYLPFILSRHERIQNCFLDFIIIINSRDCSLISFDITIQVPIIFEAKYNNEQSFVNLPTFFTMFSDNIDSDGKILKVVFDNRKSSILDQLRLEKKMREERQLYRKRQMELANEALRQDIAVIYAEFDIVKDHKQKKIVNIAKEVKKANRRENVITEKFIGDVESMVVHFKEQLDKMQELFGSIMRKLPQEQQRQVVLEAAC